MTVLLARRTFRSALFVWPNALPLALPIGAGAGLVTGLAGAFWSPAFSIWPVVVTAMGLSLALSHFVIGNVCLVRTGFRLIGGAIERIRQREALIRDQQETISHQSETLESEIHRRAILEERERFSRDIHDGLGGSLLSLLIQVRAGKIEPPDIENALEANLDELRMMIDSMDQSEQSLNAALSTFQARIRSLFGNAGITLDWVQPDIRLPERVSPDYILHLYRILQEAGSNIVRHSKAARANYRFSWDEKNQQLLISITNDGSVLADADHLHSGNGLRNMAQRVEQMQGEFQAGPGPDGGWVIQISLPV